MNENIETKVERLRPFTRFCMTIGELPTSYLMSMSYLEQIIWFTKYLQETVIPAINNNATAVEEIQNFLKTLDLQDEVDNKLDEMAESGELQEIMASYLNTKAIFSFDTISDLKQATNLINGSYAETLGYHSKNDGGNALYKIRQITNDDVVDEMFIVEINDSQDQLIAELIVDEPLRVEQIGAYGDGIHDDTLVIQNAINKVNSILLNKIYLISEIVINKTDFKMNFNQILGSIKVNATSVLQFIDIKGNRLTNESGIGLNLVSHTNFGIQYCRFSIGLIRADECIKFNASDGGWINNNFFEKTNVSYHTGITSVALNNKYYDSNMFYEFGFEGLTKWFTLNNIQTSEFRNCRMIPYEADQSSAIHELGTLVNCKGIVFDNCIGGTYWEMINTTTNSNVKYLKKVMSAGGTTDASFLSVRNGEVNVYESENPQVILDIGNLSSGTFPVQVYEYNLGKPIILDFTNGSRYMYMNLNIPANLESAIRYVTIQIIGTTANEVDLRIRNQNFHVIPTGTSDKTFTYLI